MIKLLKGLIKSLKKKSPSPKVKHVIIPRQEHIISRQAINRNALKVLYRLHEAGFASYLVGGCVRDLLLGLKPKDFDVATDASPEEIRKLFRNCILIGRRFRLAHILFGKEIIEVATFRTHHENATHELQGKSDRGMIIRDNVFGSIEDDAFRRDFRMNALYYNIADFSVVDFVGGMDDIKSRVLHMIGDPEVRFHEDPVRLIRAVRFIAKLDFTITPETEVHLMHLHHLLQNVSAARLYQEVLKIFHSGKTLKAIQLLKKYKLLSQLFPLTAPLLDKPHVQTFIDGALTNSDLRFQEGKTISAAFLFAALLWYPISDECNRLEEHRLPKYVALEKAIQVVLKKQAERLSIPRVTQVTIREICMLQHRLNKRNNQQTLRLVEHPRFRAAYDLLLLRAEAEAELAPIAEWWAKFHTATTDEKEKMFKELNNKPRKKKNKKKSQDKISS